MKRLLWWAVYAGLVYIGFVVALNTTWELQERQDEK